jgi:hypothetical protein
MCWVRAAAVTNSSTPAVGQSPNMALQRTRRPRYRSGRSLRSLGSPLNARPLAGASKSCGSGGGVRRRNQSQSLTFAARSATNPNVMSEG